MNYKQIRVHDLLFARIRNIAKPPFADPKVAIYYEQSYNEPINNYILAHYDEICREYSHHGISFVYFPMLIADIGEVIRYNFPDSGLRAPVALQPDDFYSYLSENIVEIPPTGRPMLLVNDPHNEAAFAPELLGDNVSGFYCYDLDYEDDRQFGIALSCYPSRYNHREPKPFREFYDKATRRWVEEKPAEFDADQANVETISREIQERINQLYALGVPVELLKSLLSLPEPKPSRLLITPDFRLLLPDYNNREIVLNPLPKALYFFYMRHTEGVLFKHLRDHRSELFDLYSLLSPRENIDKMNQSIDDLVDSTKNSVNVVCSRIRAAFMTQFRVELARQYFIDGDRGEPKRIALDRKLVEDRSGLIM